MLPDLAQARAAGRQLGGGALSFELSGWPEDEARTLRQWIAELYPVCTRIYGDPAFSHTVTVVRSEENFGLLGGTYDATENEIRLPPLTDNVHADQFVLVRQMLSAFRDDVALAYDVWEQGMVIAAADVVLHEYDPSYDPSYGPFYVTNLYELLNQPELAHDRIWDTGFDGMITWRLGMSSGAWSKCWVENEQFFRQFNEAYYARVAAEPGLSGNVPALVNICASVVPEVEGLSFYEWFRRQHALNTSVSLGPKLYVYNLPQQDSIIMIVDHYVTLGDSTEQPRGGTVSLEYWDFTHRFSLFVQEGYEISIPDFGPDAGQGFGVGSLFNIGGPQRVYVDLDLGPIHRTLLYPYNVRGPEEGGNSLLGVIDGRDEGELAISEDGGEATTVQVSQGSFGLVYGGGEMRPRRLTVEFTDATGQKVRRRYNTGFFFYAITPSITLRQTLRHRFAASPNGLRLITVPMWPTARDDAAVLGLQPSQFVLAHWDPTRRGDTKYAFYPLAPPFAPGRAFWLYCAGEVTVEAEGDIAPPDRQFRIFLKPGWNLFGNPFTEPVSVDSLRFDQGGGAVSFAQAVQNGWVRAVLYGYDPARGYVEAQTLEPWQGYWIRCVTADGVNMLVSPPTQAVPAGSSRAARVAERGGWELRVQAEHGAERQTLVAGAARGASAGFDPWLDAELAPAAPRAKLFAALRPTKGPLLLADVRPQASGAQRYELLVGLRGGAGEVVLRWPDIRALPRTLAPLLIDEHSGRSTYLRTAGAYRLRLGSGEVRRLRLEVAARRAGMLRIVNLVDSAARGGRALAFSLSAPACVTVRLLNAAGRELATVVREKWMGAGTNRILWRAKDSAGRPLPSGAYLVQVEARDESGQRARAVRRVVLAK